MEVTAASLHVPWHFGAHFQPLHFQAGWFVFSEMQLFSGNSCNCVVVEVLWEVSKEMPVSWAEGILAGCSILVAPPWVQHGIPKFWGQLAASQSHTQPQELSLPGL